MFPFKELSGVTYAIKIIMNWDNFIISSVSLLQNWIESKNVVLSEPISSLCPSILIHEDQ